MTILLKTSSQHFVRLWYLIPLLVLPLMLCILSIQDSYAEGAGQNTLRVAATNSLLDSGVMNVLLADFKHRYPEISIELSHAGALGVLKYAREGKADIVISHHPPGEKRFVEQGYGRDRANFVYSEFVLFGPPGKLPELAKAIDIIAALKILAEEEVEFLVPSSRSGVFAVIEELWTTAGIDPTWIGYENTGISGAENLLQASDVGAYTIMDYGTYIVNRDKYGDKISPIFRGDIALRNIYSVIIVNSKKVKGANEKLAKIFYDYLVSDEGQGVISKYGENMLHVSFLTPAASFDPFIRAKKVQSEADKSEKNLRVMTLLFAGVSSLLIISLLLFVRIRHAEKKKKESEALAESCVIDRDFAQHANELKSRFLANMSHELRTPLNAIIGYSELLEEGFTEVGDHRHKKDLLCIGAAAHHLLTLINDILDLSKIESGKMQLNCYTVDVQELSVSVCDTVRSLARERGNNVICEVSSNVSTVYADEIRLKQVLLNLLSNACKFTKNGNVTLSVRNDFSQSPATCIFEVKDTGIGISKEKQAIVFDAFVQADESTTKEFGGTGLGLAISKRFCELMEGDIQVESDIGKGTCFTVRIPFNAEDIKVAS